MATSAGRRAPRRFRAPKQFTPFPRLPAELRQMILMEAMEESIPTKPRVVEVHEERTEVEKTFEDGSKGTIGFQHLGSKTTRPPLFRVCSEAESVAWRYFDKLEDGVEDEEILEEEKEERAKEKEEMNQLCPHSIPFKAERDTAYFTQDSLRTWSKLWKEYSPDREECALNFDEGNALKAKVQSIAFDAGLLIGDDEAGEDGWTRDKILMEGLGQGLASFPALKEIYLVMSLADARIYARRKSKEEAGQEYDRYEGPLSDDKLRPDRGMASIHWRELTAREDEEDSDISHVLLDAANYLEDELDFYFNEFERRQSRAYFKRQEQKIRPPREIPLVYIMVMM